MTELGKGFYRVCARYGFLQNPDVPEVLELRGRGARPPDHEHHLLPRPRDADPEPQARHGALAREALRPDVAQRRRPTDFFRIPANRVVELGMQIQL